MENLFLGIDIGSVAISAALVNEKNEIVESYYDFHKGQIVKKLSDFLNNIEIL